MITVDMVISDTNLEGEPGIRERVKKALRSLMLVEPPNPGTCSMKSNLRWTLL